MLPCAVNAWMLYITVDVEPVSTGHSTGSTLFPHYHTLASALWLVMWAVQCEVNDPKGHDTGLKFLCKQWAHIGPGI